MLKLVGLLCWLAFNFLLSTAVGSALKDPTRPADYRGDFPAFITLGPQVQAILTGKGRAFAQVDGRMVKVGDSVSGYQVSAITAQTVWFEKDGKKISGAVVEPLSL